MVADELSLIVTFSRVAETGTFSAAAEHLHVAPSVVSRHIARLEAELGARLVHRTTRKLALTDAGHAYYAHCRRILEEMELSRETVASLQGELRGQLRVNSTVGFGPLVLTPLLPAFRRRYPKLELKLSFTDRMIDLVKTGHDLALRFIDAPPPNMVARRLAHEPDAICAAPAYLRAHGVPTSPAELERHACLVLESHDESHDWRFRRGATEWHVRPRHGYRINYAAALLDLAVRGEGILVLPEYMLRSDLEAGRLVRVLEDCTFIDDNTLHAIYPQSRQTPQKVRVFLDFLARHLQPDAARAA
ncbi:MAG: LysR family transcriptional regulator [Mizugakiibacter sp.]|uniref:LysR family transcriptional regulator n=1 Tax=Mizugakiibacter sp. TaxID=1972610 RepID=UPI0031C4EE76|nr:LysR family transcriptional regulator [Xanthomonadaceae bacterium]